MTLALMSLGIGVIIELLSIFMQKYNRLLGAFSIALSVALAVVGSTVALLLRPNISLILVWLLSGYHIVNLLRLGAARLEPKHLRRISLRTSLALIIMQACILIAWVLLEALYYSDRKQWLILTGLLALGAVYVNTMIWWHVHSRRSLPAELPPTGTNIPTVSILIPARNETDELEACLEAWVRSDYPKFEVIVLDDCSQTARTPEIIRQFAHGGVRFIPGKPVKRGWLAKNQAYDTLAAEATGELLVFCGVDARVRTDSLRTLVADFHAQNKQMVSVLPQNYLHAGTVSPLQVFRYGRELLRGPWSEQPPVLSTLWMINADMLLALGGFAAVRRSVLPETYFGRVLDVQQTYDFWIGTAARGVASSKRMDEQYDTAVRTLYPSLHKQPEVVALTTLAVVAVTFLPPLLLISSLFAEDWLMAVLALIGTLVALSSYRIVLRVAYGEARARHVYGWLAAALAWVKCLHYSMYKYEFSEVDWKGRNICIPVMNRTTAPLANAKLAKVRNKYRKD